MINIVGASSSGKTTAARFAGSIYGVGVVRTWLTTGNAVEDYLQSHSGSLLILDEAHLAGADARARANLLSNAVMTLAAGQGKARKGQVLLPPTRLLVISTSNTHLVSGAPNSAAIDPALQVRMPAIDLLGRPHGILDHVPDGNAVSIINAVNAGARRFGGAPARAFVMRLTDAIAREPQKLRFQVSAILQVFNRAARRAGPLTPLDERIIGRFALADAAGVLAKMWGIFPSQWDEHGAGLLDMFQMARDGLRATAHTDPIARVDLVLGRIRGRFYEVGRTSGTASHDGFIGTISRRQSGVIELAMPKADFNAHFDSIDHRLLQLLRECGGLAVEAIGQDGAVRHTVKRQLFPGRDPERVVAIRLDPAAYPAAVKVRRAE